MNTFNRLDILKQYGDFIVENDPTDNSYIIKNKKSDIRAVVYMNGEKRYYIDDDYAPIEIDIETLDLLRRLLEINKKEK